MSHQNKKQKIDESSKDPVVHFDTERIPIEIWNGIFKYNETEDLLNLSLVCKKFYETIEKTPETIDKIVLRLFEVLKPEDSLILSRNYTNIRLEFFSDMQEYLNVFQKFGPTLKHLEMNDCILDADQMVDILELVQSTLKTLELFNWYWSSSYRHNNDNPSSKKFKLSKLEKLTVTQDYEDKHPLILVDFLPNTLTELDIDVLTMGERYLNFLQNQKNLTHLSLRKCENWDIFKTIDDKKVEFKLKSLKIISLNSDPSSDCEHFYKFLKSQADSLVTLRLEDISLIDTYGVFENMPKLQELEIVSKSDLQYETGPAFCLPSLRKLKVYFYKVWQGFEFFKRFNDLQQITLHMKPLKKYFEMMAEKHPNLKKLVLRYFDDCYFNSVSLKSVLELVVIGNENIRTNEDGEEQIEDIQMENSLIAMENMKVIKFREDISLSSKTLLWTLVNCKKLKHLEIDNGSVLNHTFLLKNVKFFKNLEFLKIGMLDKPPKKFKKKLKLQSPNLTYLSTGTPKDLYDAKNYYDEYDYFEYGGNDADIISDNNENDTDNFNDYDDSSDNSEDSD